MFSGRSCEVEHGEVERTGKVACETDGVQPGSGYASEASDEQKNIAASCFDNRSELDIPAEVIE